MFVKIIRKTHKILGIPLSILLLVWFVSGLVMVYHTFPKVSPSDRIAKMDLLDVAELPSIDSISAREPKLLSARSLTLNRYLGQTTFHAGKDIVFADSLESEVTISSDRIMEIASLWNSSDIIKIDTLDKVDQWIPFGHYDKLMPIYKFHFHDKDKHQLYIASTNGNVLQYTDRSSRFWAWIGAIPHWIYFTQLRQNSPLWMQVVIWLAAITCIMTLAGMFMSLYIWIKSKKIVPYKKRWFKWHHILGLIFGLITLTFAFSGLMSLANSSGWVPKPQMKEHPMKIIKKGINPCDYKLDYRDAIAAYPDSKQIEWAAFLSKPYYIVRSDDKVQYIDASRPQPKPLKLTEQDCCGVVEAIHGEGVDFTAMLLTESDRYYIGRKHKVELPVWRIEINDEEDLDNSTYYINPKNGETRYVNNTSRWMHWLYPALHSLRFKWLVDNPILWTATMWFCMIGGAALSFTGIWLSVKYLMRCFKRR